MLSEKNHNFNWIKGAKIYQVFTDRFSGYKKDYTDEELRKGFLYGNLKSLITKLDYIKSMNFNMIWISPFYVNQPKGYHGYHSQNYNHVDPRFAYGEKVEDDNVGNVFDPNDANIETGADLVLKELVKECHKRDLKIMMDFVPNHSYVTHPFFIDAEKNINSKYRNWFYFIKEEETKEEESKDDKKKKKKVKNLNKKKEEKDISVLNKKRKRDKEPKYRYLAFLGFSDLPKLNLDNPEVQDHLIKSTKKFLSYGIDAVRVDHAIGPSKKSLKAIISKIHKDYPNVPFIGEILPFGCSSHSETILGVPKKTLEKLNWMNLESLKTLDELYISYDGILDGVLDFSFQMIVDRFVTGKIIIEECIKEIEEHFKRYENHKNFILVKNIDSHDCDRILFRCKNDMNLFDKAVKLLYRDYVGRNDPLIVYYGTEVLMSQEKTIHGEPYGDFRCRQPMKFGDIWKFFKDQKWGIEDFKTQKNITHKKPPKIS